MGNLGINFNLRITVIRITVSQTSPFTLNLILMIIIIIGFVANICPHSTLINLCRKFTHLEYINNYLNCIAVKFCNYLSFSSTIIILSKKLNEWYTSKNKLCCHFWYFFIEVLHFLCGFSFIIHFISLIKMTFVQSFFGNKIL